MTIAVGLTAFILMSGVGVSTAVLDLVAALDVLLCTIAAALLHAVIVDLRLEVGAERVALASRAATQARERVDEHLRLVWSLATRLRVEKALSGQLGIRVRHLEARLSQAESELARLRDAEWSRDAAPALRIVQPNTASAS